MEISSEALFYIDIFMLFFFTGLIIYHHRQAKKILRESEKLTKKFTEYIASLDTKK